MPTDKPKRKNAPRSRRLLLAAVILVLLIFGGFIAFPYAETRLNQWLENDPFTPICNVPHMELVYESGEADSWGARLYRMRGDGSDRVALTEESTASYDPDWSDDGQWLLIQIDDQGWIDQEVLNLATGESTYLNTLWPWSFSWSPDGRYLEDSDDGSGLYSWSLSYPSEPNTPIFHAVSSDDPRWSPDGRQIILSETSPLHPEIGETVLIDTHNGFERHVLYNGISKLLGWSPDGAFFAFIAEDNLWLVEFDLVSRQPIEVQIIVHDVNASWISWSPDNQTVALGRSIDSYFTTFLTTFVDIESGDFIWEIVGPTPDGWLNSNVVRLKNASNPNNPSWAYGYIETQSLEPISVSIETDGLSLARFYTILSSDLDYLIYTTHSGSEESLTARLYLADGNGEHRQLLTTQSVESDYQSIYRTTPDGQYISYEGENSWLYLLSLETRRACRVVKGKTIGATNYDWRLIPEAER